MSYTEFKNIEQSDWELWTEVAIQEEVKKQDHEHSMLRYLIWWIANSSGNYKKTPELGDIIKLSTEEKTEMSVSQLIKKIVRNN